MNVESKILGVSDISKLLVNEYELGEDIEKFLQDEIEICEAEIDDIEEKINWIEWILQKNEELKKKLDKMPCDEEGTTDSPDEEVSHEMRKKGHDCRLYQDRSNIRYF